MKKLTHALGIAALLVGITGLLESTEEAATATEVIAKVRQAASLFEEHGDAALDMIVARKSDFRWKDTYIFVVDCEADRVMINLAFPERVGGDIRQHTDYAGYQYGNELCTTAANGGGWIEYVWLRPGEEMPVRKVSYVAPVAGGTYQVGAGIYDERTTLESLEAL